MIDPHEDITDQAEYKEGIDWAVMHHPELAERYSSNNLMADALRTHLWKVAATLYPSRRGDPENDLRQTIFVAGAIRRVIDTLPMNPEAMREVFDIAMDMGQWYGAERWKLAHFLELKKKDASWWRKKQGDASPDQIVGALTNRWWREFAKEKDATRTSRWEVLVDTLGTREMSALASLKKIEYEGDGEYKTYTVMGDDSDFQIMAAPVWTVSGGRRILAQGMGDWVG